MSSSSNHPGDNLPASLTPCIGRDQEYTQLVAQLGDPACRLVTITGIGGIGKTRLALEAARALVPAKRRDSPFDHGVFFVPLAAPRTETHKNKEQRTENKEPGTPCHPLTCSPVHVITSSGAEDALALAIAGALGIGLSGPDTPAIQVRRYLRAKALLLVLDSGECVLEGVPYILALLQDAPQLKIIATSREPLNLRGEWVFPLDGLAFPARGQAVPAQSLDQHGAIQLFIHSARRVAPDFALSEATAPIIARICRLVEGLPLAIEYAANWMRSLTCAEIADEIAANLDFLSSSNQDLPARQQSLRAVFASAWSMLCLEEQIGLRRLALFRGSFTRQAAAAVAGVSLPTLGMLMSKSLVRRLDAREPSCAPRFELPELLRRYAAEQLERAGETSHTMAAHAAYYLDVLHARLVDLRGPGQLGALAAIGADIEHIRDAWHWAVANGDSAAIGRTADSLFHFYDMQSWFQEGVEAFGIASQAFAARQDDTARPILAKVLARKGWFVFQLGHQREARALLEYSLALLEESNASADRVFTLNYLAAICSYLGEYAATQRYCRESLEVARAIGYRYGEAIAYNVLGQTAHAQAAHAAAQDWCRQSLAIEQQIGNRWSMAFSLSNLGKVAYEMQSYAEARRLFEQSLLIRTEMRDTRGVAICFNYLGNTAVALDAPIEARERYAQSLTLFREIGNQWGVATTLTHLGQLASAQESSGAAAYLLGEALRLALEIQALPQVANICAACARLARRHDAAWADELARLAQAEPATIELYQPHVGRLFAWPRDRHAAPDGPIETIDQAIRVIHTSDRPARAYPGGLTSREVEVLRLVAQGLTDAQVAEKLVLSRRTVSTHLTSIYGKLQVSSRSGATRVAIIHGLC